MRYLLNLSSQGFVEGCAPWEFKPTEIITDDLRVNKKMRDAWINNPSTKHYIYSAFEGVNPNIRISKLKNDESGNPVHSMRLLVADYDFKLDEATVLKHASALPIPPNWIERTLSGNWRFLWLFEAPIMFASYEHALHFLEKFADFAFDPKLGMIGWDEGAWCDPSRMFTNSCDWRPLNPKPIAKEITQGWLVKSTQTFKFTKSAGISIPLDVIKPELEKRYPKFAEWPSDFTLESQGPTFWIEGSTSPKSAIVKEQGILTFSDHATKGFYSWADLLGVEFTKSYENDALGRATEGIFFDNRSYHIKTGSGIYCPNDRTDTYSHLKISRKISAKADKDGSSEIDKCLEYIRVYQRIQIAAPFPFFPTGLIEMNRERMLNTSNLKVTQPADGPAPWGAEGPFKWVSYFYDNFFSTQRQWPYYMSWLAYFYQSALRQEPLPGHAAIFVGVQGTGKTFNSTVLLPCVFNGFRDGSKFMMGDDKFGGELFETGLITIDDAVHNADPHSKRKYSEMLKKFVANTNAFHRNSKYVKGISAPWIGRVLVTMNCDEESLMGLPDIDRANLDKLMMFRCADKPIIFPGYAEMKEILAREIPYFCRFLADWKTPPECQTTAVRFGVSHFHEFSLIESAQLSSKSASFNEVLIRWKDDYFKVNPKVDFWEGTAHELHLQFLLEPHAEQAIRNLTPAFIGQQLSSLKNKGERLECRTKRGVRIWKIHKDTETNG